MTISPIGIYLKNVHFNSFILDGDGVKDVRFINVSIQELKYHQKLCINQLIDNFLHLTNKMKKTIFQPYFLKSSFTLEIDIDYL